MNVEIEYDHMLLENMKNGNIDVPVWVVDDTSAALITRKGNITEVHNIEHNIRY